MTKNIRVPAGDRLKYALNDEEILQLAQACCLIEEHYSQVRGVCTPMDIEWAKDGITNELFIVQARPETVQSQKSKNVLRTYQLQQKGEVLSTGRSVGEMIGQGKARVILDVQQINQFQAGEVLVTNRTDPDWEPIMKRASAIVTNQGGRTCHSAIENGARYQPYVANFLAKLLQQRHNGSRDQIRSYVFSFLCLFCGCSQPATKAKYLPQKSVPRCTSQL